MPQSGAGTDVHRCRPRTPRLSQVKDWGSGEPRDLGSLQVESQAQAAQAGGSPGQPFYEALARRLELLQAQGAIGIAQVCPAVARGWSQDAGCLRA